MSIYVPTIVTMYHPLFRKGYQEGRNTYFQDPVPLSDKQLVESIQFVFEDLVEEEEGKRQRGIYYGIGQLIGKISGVVIPRSPHENTETAQEAFLATIERQYGSSVVDAIKQLWARQDTLAKKLDADTFDEMLKLHTGTTQ